ncbi:MAG: hypothetical protein GQ474_03180 [Sulfurimonas sp.]|nr:hypothetical protein [Sulfurimonas sp.]
MTKYYKEFSYFHKQSNNKSIFTLLNKFSFTLVYSLVIFSIFLNMPLWQKTGISLIPNVYAQELEKDSKISEKAESYDFYQNTPEKEYFNTIKDVRDREIADLLSKGSIMYMTVTAYNSEVAQCDSTPCITADGFNLCEHNQEDVIATNILPFGTKVMFPELFGDRVFTVHDRMNAKYSYRADVWMRDHGDAIQFGANYNIQMVIVK